MTQKTSKLETLMAAQILAHAIPTPRTEYRFCERGWRFDFAWPADYLALEVEGGTWAGGRHQTPQGFTGDCEKYNRATLLGWRVLRVTGDQVREGRAIEWVMEALSEWTMGAEGADVDFDELSRKAGVGA